VRPEWSRHFDEKGVHGTFVLFEPAKDRYLVLDPARAKQGFIPASTFKIPNALIGLEVGSIGDENEVFHWDGKPKPYPEWERDQTLASGMRYSVVWMFQEVARRTGKERMKEWIAKLDYGNRDIRGGIDLFWLHGAIRISAMQQVEFLRKLAEGELPMTQRSQRLVRNALVLETNDPVELVTELALLKERPKLAASMRRRGRTTARSYVWEKVIDELLLRIEFAAAQQAVRTPPAAPEPKPAPARTRKPGVAHG